MLSSGCPEGVTRIFHSRPPNMPAPSMLLSWLMHLKSRMLISHSGAAARAIPDLALHPVPAPLPPPPQLRAAASCSRHPSSFPTANGGEAASVIGSRGCTPAASPSPAHRGAPVLSLRATQPLVGDAPSRSPTGIPRRRLCCIELRVGAKPPFVQVASRYCA
jgi:hypothetical protein